MMLTLALYPDEILQRPTRPVTTEELASDEVQQLITDMVAFSVYLSKTPRGCAGLAAPQVNSELRICTVRKPGTLHKGADAEFDILVNPIIKKFSGSREVSEGCLSVPLMGSIRRKRAKHVTVSGLDRNGKPFTLKASGTSAHILQHEIGHLDGHLMFEKED